MSEKCKLCQEELKGVSLTCSKGSICMECSNNLTLFSMQPLQVVDSNIWVLAETYFRKGKGEDINFEKVWKEKNGRKMLITFDDWYGVKSKKGEGDLNG